MILKKVQKKYLPIFNLKSTYPFNMTESLTECFDERNWKEKRFRFPLSGKTSA